MAIACLRVVTFLPELDLSEPDLYSDITFLTFFWPLVGFFAAITCQQEVLPHTIGRFAEVLWFGEVESLEAEVAQSVKSVVHAKVFVGETRSGGVGQGAQGFDEFLALGVDEEAARSSRIQ